MIFLIFCGFIITVLIVLIRIYFNIIHNTKVIYLKNSDDTNYSVNFLSDKIYYEDNPPHPKNVFFKNISKSDREKIKSNNIIYDKIFFNDKKNKIEGYTYIYRINI